MAKRTKSTSLVHRADPSGVAAEMDDLKSMALKLTASELDNKEIKDWCRNYRSWRQRMNGMEEDQWNELARILKEESTVEKEEEPE